MKHYSKFFTNATPDKDTVPKRPLTEQELDKEINSIGNFIRSGLVIMSVMLLSVIAIGYGQKNLVPYRTASTNAILHNKKLPIYCVEQKEKKIALSFDAAWGKSFFLENSSKEDVYE